MFEDITQLKIYLDNNASLYEKIIIVNRTGKENCIMLDIEKFKENNQTFYRLCYNGRIKTFSRQREILEYIDIAYFFNSDCLFDNIKSLIKKAN